MMNMTVLVFFLLFSLALGQTSGSFTKHPEDYTAILGERHTFSCEFESSFPQITISYQWTVTTPDGTNLITRDHAELPGLKAIGVEFNETWLSIPCNSRTNGTMVVCQVIPFHEFSNSATITVLGPPTPPEPALRAVNNTLVISWAPAWSWPDHPVIHYTVTLTNTTDGTVYTNLTNQTVWYFTREEEAELRCDVMVVNVTATSDIGESEVGQVVGGFPIPPAPFKLIDCEDCIVTLILPSTTPIYTFQFKLPDICPYQTGHYTVQLHGPGWITQLVEKTEYTTSNTTEPITMEVDSGLAINNTYSVVVLVGNSEGSTNTRNTFNTKIEIPSDPRPNPTIIQVTEDKAIVAAGIVIGVILLVATVVVIAVVLYMYRRRRQSGVAELNLAKMIMEGTTDRPSRGGPYVQNETRIYESIDGYQGKCYELDLTHPPPLPSVPPSREHLYTTSRLNVPKITFECEKDRDSNAYLQLLGSENGKNNDADVRSIGSGEYTSMKSVSLRNTETTGNVAAVNRLAVQTAQGFNEDNYMVFMEQGEKD